MQGRITHKTK